MNFIPLPSSKPRSSTGSGCAAKDGFTWISTPVSSFTTVPIRFFAEGFEYRVFGVFPTTRHLIGVDSGGDAAQTIFLLGTDVQGRDLWSRLMYGTRISLTIGLLGVAVSLVLGMTRGQFYSVFLALAGAAVVWWSRRDAARAA